MVSLRQKYICFFMLLFCVLFLHGRAVCAAEDTSFLPEVIGEGNIYEVNPDGTKDFVTIQEGVDSVESGDTLLIYPGTYKENVIIENKTVNLLGVDPQYCILTANSDNYHSVPLTIAAGKVSNLTICGTRGREVRTALPRNAKKVMESISDPDQLYALQDQFSGYAIHADHSYSTGKTLSIENCRIISENNYCIGLGCWDSAEITIADCELIAGGDSGCVFLHNIRYSSEAGTAHVTIKNSSLKNYVGPYVMSVHSEGPFGLLDLTFQNVKVSTVAYEDNKCYSDTVINTWFSIDQLKTPAVQAVLVENGYLNFSESSQLVHQGTAKQHMEFKKILKERKSLLKGWPQLAEGITYWESTSDVVEIPGKVRHSIGIKNADGGAAGDGWCGLTGIYLTEDSCGNTLPEMNYPRIAESLDAE